VAWSFIAQRATTGEFLDWDVPLTLGGLEWQLSGPGSLKAKIEPDVGGLRASDGGLILEEWGTLIHAESDGQIRWSGIVISCSFNGEAWDLEAAGYSTYPHAVTWEGDYSGIGVDPAYAIRLIWEHIQGFPDGDLGVRVTGITDTGTSMGHGGTADTIKAEDGSLVPLNYYGPQPPEGAEIVKGEEPAPYVLNWTESTNCGEEIESLTKLAPLDFVEHHYWTPDHETIVHEIELAYPRAGRRRDDLVFSQGDNVISVVTVESNGDEFANTVIGLGAGEGQAMVRRETSVRDGRLRRVHVHVDKSIAEIARMDAAIAEELNARRAALRVESIDVMDHPNAPLGSWQLGDDVLVRAELPWLGEVEVWCRVVGWTLTSENTATISLVRSDLYRYGGMTS